MAEVFCPGMPPEASIAPAITPALAASTTRRTIRVVRFTKKSPTGNGRRSPDDLYVDLTASGYRSVRADTPSDHPADVDSQDAEIK